MISAVEILLIVSLSFQVLPATLGIETNKNPGKSVWYGLILVAGQVLFLWLGFVTGNRFMHLLEEYKSIVVFAGFFIIGVRMVLDSFKVRKGERTYKIDNTLPVALASVAFGINTFLAGMLFAVLPVDSYHLLITMTIACLVVTATGTAMKPGKAGLAFTSFIFFTGGAVIIVSSVYLGFFI